MSPRDHVPKYEVRNGRNSSSDVRSPVSFEQDAMHQLIVAIITASEMGARLGAIVFTFTWSFRYLFHASTVDTVR